MPMQPPNTSCHPFQGISSDLRGGQQPQKKNIKILGWAAPEEEPNERHRELLRSRWPVPNKK